MQQHGSRNLPADPPSLDPACQKVNIQTFSENTLATYQIKWKNECSNIVANILLADKPGCGIKIQLFQNMVMLHVKLKGIMNTASW